MSFFFETYESQQQPSVVYSDLAAQDRDGAVAEMEVNLEDARHAVSGTVVRVSDDTWLLGFRPGNAGWDVSVDGREPGMLVETWVLREVEADQ